MARFDLISRELRSRIEQGVFKAGSRLPAIRELSEDFDTTPRTLSKALGVLQSHGYVRSVPRVGWYVQDEWDKNDSDYHAFSAFLAFDTTSSVFWAQTLDGLAAACHEHDLDIVVAPSNHDFRRAKQQIARLSTKGVGVFVFVPIEASNEQEFVDRNMEIVREIESRGGLCLLFDRSIPDYNGHIVTLDHYEAVVPLVKHLRQQHVRRPLLLTVRYSSAIAERERAVLDQYSKSAQVVRLDVDRVRPDHDVLVVDALDQHRDCDGIIGLNANTTNGITRALAVRNDNSTIVVGFEDMPLENPDRVSLRAVQPVFEYGYAAGTALLSIVRASNAAHAVRARHRVELSCKHVFGAVSS